MNKLILETNIHVYEKRAFQGEDIISKTKD